ncbi:MAG: SdiA-regulated domain-containing protein, partial [Woeseiaceae bacterium]
DRLNPSGIAVEARSGHLLIVAAGQYAVIELTREGRFVDARRLPQSTRHRQAEGIEVTTDGRLLLADEGGTHKGRLATYLPAPDG